MTRSGVRLDRITTGGGDQGETSLGDGSRVRKDDARIEACGTIDEANAAIGLARLQACTEIDVLLQHVQNDLFDIGADLCVPKERKRPGARYLDAESLAWIEQLIRETNADIPPLRSFVLPAGPSSSLHLARAIVRRAERTVVTLAAREEIHPVSAIYLNRLSDLLFILARKVNLAAGGDVLWEQQKSKTRSS